MNEEQRKEWIQAAKEQVLRNARETDQCERDLMELYSECAMQLEKEIRAFYSKYASDNQLTETEASRDFSYLGGSPEEVTARDFSYLGVPEESKTEAEPAKTSDGQSGQNE